MSRAESVHPRLRGELKKLRLRAAATNGSSPLTRGTRRDEYPVLGHLRFIPAYAGNSLLGFYRRSGRTVHPRLRGELLLTRCPLERTTGSSPLTRGTRVGIHFSDGINGSSPLTRGTHELAYPNNQPSRFIPAYAGNSLFRMNRSSLRTVHPRLRGELT